MKVENKKLESGELEIKLTFSKFDQVCLEHDLLDIVEWYVLGPSLQKIQSCKKRMIDDNRDKVMKNPELLSYPLSEVNAILEDHEKCVRIICNHPDYKNRKQRELLI
jgi:hypothetical protein